MKPSVSSRILLGLVLFTALAASVHAQKFSSAHWKFKTLVEGSGSGQDVGAEGEMWLKNGTTRMKSEIHGMKSNMIVAEGAIYQWIDGHPTGMKMPRGPKTAASSPDYVNMDIRAKGKKIGTETIDGSVCDVYLLEVTEHGQKAKHTGWLRRDKSGFPAKWVVEAGNAKTTTTNRDIEIPATVPESMMTLPTDVRFQDMAEMMKTMPRQ